MRWPILPLWMVFLGCASTAPSSDVPVCSEAERLELAQAAAGVPLIRIRPRYPRDALQRGITGRTCHGFTVDLRGFVTELCLIEPESDLQFADASAEALRRWKYRPAAEPYRGRVCLDYDLR